MSKVCTKCKFTFYFTSEKLNHQGWTPYMQVKFSIECFIQWITIYYFHERRTIVVSYYCCFIFCISCIWTEYSFLWAKSMVSWNLIDFPQVGNWSNFNEPKSCPLNLHISPNTSAKYRAENRDLFRALPNIYEVPFCENT